MKYLVLGIFSMSLCLFAQEDPREDSLQKARLDMLERFEEKVTDTAELISFNQVHCDPRLALLMKKHIAYHEENPYIEGYRVQLRKSDDMDELMQLRSKFLELFPNEFIKIEGNLPNFLLRVGNYVGVWGIWEAKLQAGVMKRYFERAVHVRTSIYVHDLMESNSHHDQ